MEFHATRSVVLARPALKFEHISVFNVILHKNGVRFLIIGDVGVCCAFFDLSINHLLKVKLVEAYNEFPPHITTSNDRAQFFVDFMKNKILRNGIFDGRSLPCDVFDVVACDGIGSRDFCPGFNLFRIRKKHCLSAYLRNIDPIRFKHQSPHTTMSSFIL